jgi:hypothetical protein
MKWAISAFERDVARREVLRLFSHSAGQETLGSDAAPGEFDHVTRFGAGVHTYTKPGQDLPVGIAPTATQF